MQIDLRVMELIASKLCHDLVSPVSAISNGVELIEDIGKSVTDEAMKLIGDSVTQASRRLKLFRIAYGRAGGENHIGVNDVRQVIANYFLGGKIALHWPEGQPDTALAEQRGFLKTLLNVLMLAEEVLAYGGNVTLESAEGEAPSCRLIIAGRAAHLSPAHQEALEGRTPIEDLTPRTIQAYVTGCFAEQFGLRLAASAASADRLDLVLSVVG